MRSVDSATITVVVENRVDMLLTDEEHITRFGLFAHFDPPHGEPIGAENGLAIWIKASAEAGDCNVLFDASLTARALLHNLRALGLAPDALDYVILSHGHPDHYGGLLGLLAERTDDLRIVVHPNAFDRKYFVNDDGEKVFEINRGLDRAALETAGGVILESRAAREISPGILATGEIPRTQPGEPPVPKREGRGGIYVERNGILEDDEAPIDDQALVVNVRDRGLVVITACGHSGIANTIRYAQEVTRERAVYAVMGGFHTGFPGVPKDCREIAIATLKNVSPTIVAPMHCSGLAMTAEAFTAFPEAFVENVTGTTIDV